MGGGQSGGASAPATPPPVDLLGGQFASFSGGTPQTGLFGLERPQWQAISTGIGKGFQSYGQGVAAGGAAGQGGGNYVPQFAQEQTDQALPVSLIPKTGATGNEVLDALQRMGVM